jgi:predicted HTH domain antitoxin
MIMTQQSITVTIPEDILHALKTDIRELSLKMRFEMARKYYEEHALSLGKAAELAGMDRSDFFEALLKTNAVVFNYDQIDLETELRGVDPMWYSI